MISRKYVLDVWYKAQDAIVAEAEARKELEHLYKTAEEKKRIFLDMIDKPQEL